MDGSAASAPQTKKICVIGTPSSGKSVALEKISDAIRQRRTGFPNNWTIGLWDRSPELDDLANDNQSERGKITTTDTKYWYDIQIQQPSADGSSEMSERFKIEILDVPGEIFTRPRDHEETRKNYDEWKEDCDGAVVMLATPFMFGGRQAEHLVNEIRSIARLGNDRPGKGPKRLAIAISMSEFLTAPFGPFAADVATDADYMLKLTSDALRHLRNEFFQQLEDTRKFAQLSDLDIRVIPISNFGYFPKVGSANISPDTETLVVQDRVLSKPLKTGVYFPFLVADPFVFAATGKTNAFLYEIDQLFSA